MMRAFVKSAATTAFVFLVACGFFALITAVMMAVR
jgi:hypothetical protein